jgi:membrane protein implicated in regulation of membrane protease activity
MGRSSLFVYWIHVELVYGYASWSIHRRLPLWGTALAYVAFTACVYLAIVLRDRVVDAWRKRNSQIAFQYKVEPV